MRIPTCLTWTVLFGPCLLVATVAEQCSVYLAESSTSTEEEPKWGLYAGRKFEVGSTVGYPDVGIQTFNMVGNARTKEQAQDAEFVAYPESVVDFLEQFIWVPDASGGKFELDKGRVVTAIPGAGVVGAYNSELVNSEWNHSSAYFRPPLGEVPGAAHPGRGAYSNFYDVSLKAKHTIPPGMEIFVDYGENYEDDEESEEEISRKDYDRIDQVVDRILDFYDEFEDEMTAEAKADIYNFLIKDVMGAAAGATKGRKIQNLLPNTPEGLREMKKKGGSFMFNKPDVVRDEQWLEKNALCMSNLKMGASTIPNAGRGAFATVPIRKGEMISPIPLIHIPDQTVMHMHDIGEGEDDEGNTFYFKDSEEVKGKQLILNYCFGHPESSMLFLPAGSVTSFINHKSKPNAKLVWSSHEKNNKDWFDLSVKDMMNEEQQYIGLLMEVVATRDIKEGEEVFINYGDDWEKAWKEHEKSWSEKVTKGEIESKWPLRALDMNGEYKNKIYKTEEELEKEPYSGNVELRCFLVVENVEGDDDETEEGIKKRRWTRPEKGTVFDSEHLFECRVLERQEAKHVSPMPYNYTVLWGEGSDDETIVDQVPHNALVFVDKAGTGDQFVAGAFRHYISIPDEIFPKGAWRDLA